LDWIYTSDPPEDFFSPFISGSKRYPNDNTIVCEGDDGNLFEVDVDGQVLWRYVNPEGVMGVVPQGEVPTGNMTFRCYRYPPDYPGFVGKDMTPGPPLEIYPITIAETEHSPVEPTQFDSVFITSKVYSDNGLNSVEANVDTGNGFQSVTMFDDGAHHDGVAGDSVYGVALPPISSSTEVEYYILTEDAFDSAVVDPTVAPATNYRFTVGYGPYLCGDADASGVVNVSDGVYIIAYIFSGGAPPAPPESGDVDCNGVLNISDVVYLLNYIFAGGPAPCADCP
jgi:hypothetical protein